MASVLVVEDNPLNMKLASLLLHSAGHTVMCAVDAQAGLALAQAIRPDLILMDCQLPGMSGLAATTLLKADPATAPIPVIALTALGTDADRENARNAGCDAYIVKPLSYRELYLAIDMLLSRGDADASGIMVSRPPSHLNALPSTAGPSLHPRGVVGGRANPVPAVDVGILEGLIGDEPVLVLEFLRVFQIGAVSTAQELRSACANRQAVLAGRQAHKLKSSAQIAGAVALGNLCAEMEAAGRAGKLAALLALLPAFEDELAVVDALLDTMRARGSARA